MHVLSLGVRVRIRQAQSLKDKRSVVRSLLERSQARHGVAVAEVGDIDDVGLSRLGFVTVSGTVAVAEDTMDRVEREIWSRTEVEVLDMERTWMELDR